MSLSTQTIQDKNALNSTAVILTLLKITIPNNPVVNLVANNENITWNGDEYIAFPFEFEDRKFSSQSELSQWTVKVSNANRVIEQYVQEYDLYLKQNGIQGNKIVCEIYAVNSNDLANTEPILYHNAYLAQPQTNAQWATFILEPDDPNQKIFPPRFISKNHCGWIFKSTQCGYAGVGAFCDKTLTTCRSYSNSSRFGGFPGVAGRGVIVAN